METGYDQEDLCYISEALVETNFIALRCNEETIVLIMANLTTTHHFVWTCVFPISLSLKSITETNWHHDRWAGYLSEDAVLSVDI